MTITRLRAWITRTPFSRPVTWTTGGTEDAAFHLWLEVTHTKGTRGLSETPVKPAWTGLDGPTTLAAVEHLVAPRTLGQTLDGAALSDIRGLTVLKAALDHAVADLATTGVAASAPVAMVLTRAAPDVMAEIAHKAVCAHGLRALKVKAGQGLDTDGAVIAAARDVLGAEGQLTVDANSSYDREGGLALCGLAADHGCAFVEDPWPLTPDAATGEALAQAACPVAADRIAGDPDLLAGLVDRGVDWIAVKPNRIGPAAARHAAAVARAAGASVVSGLFGEGPLGAVQQLRGPRGDTPIEALHYLGLSNPVPVKGMSLSGGNLSAPEGRASELVAPEDIADRAIAFTEVSQ
jgi:L-alanine-DL-glutamate epimerase-like enolase superfamily enzyme